MEDRLIHRAYQDWGYHRIVDHLAGGVWADYGFPTTGEPVGLGPTGELSLYSSLVMHTHRTEPRTAPHFIQLSALAEPTL
jgi:hypothetical protein